MYLLIIFSFLIGSIPFGVIVSRLFFGFDIRTKGSGNMGSTNVYRILGVKWGIIVQILDIFKGIIPTLVLVHQFSLDYNIDFALLKIIAGLSSVLGHIFSPFVKFKGGKGINTAVGMMIGISPIDLGVCVVIFLGSVFTTGMISVGALLGSIVLPLSLIIRHNYIKEVPGYEYLLGFFILMTCLIFYTHRSNIKRLRNGDENKFEKLQIIKF